MRKVLILASLLATTLLAGCEASRIPGVYRIDVQQGNVVTPEQLARLEPGMEQRKVRFIMGSPLLVDVFNQERWDYVYEYRPGSVFGDPVHRRVSLFFANSLLERVEGDIEAATPDEMEAPRELVVTVPDLPRDDGFFSGLNPFDDDSPPPARDESVAQPVGETAVDSDASAAIGTDAAADATARKPAVTRDKPIPDANAKAKPEPQPEQPKESAGGGFFRGLAESFGFGDGDKDTAAE